jgi:uncharacterized protein YdiU (UPF0061 family)
MKIAFDNTYARLPERFFTALPPTPVGTPGLIAVNDVLARDLGLDPDALRTEDGLAVLAGNSVPDGASPLAQVYAGHQFGGWSQQLGDGRAVLLGEVIGINGARRDIQLKGSGPTPYSRMGDGRAWLGPVIREYIVSEAMHAFGIPTTRALAAVTSGQTIMREAPFPGAVLTRVAASHIRVGTFQFFASRKDLDGLQALTDYVIARHYPQANGALGLLNAVINAQALLIAQWMGVGFIHGVMNTDNMTISGETIDYGPCAFMDAYHPDTVFSSIDQFGRYAYKNQPEIAVWNLAQLATSLLPLMGEDRDAAIEAATQSVQRFSEVFNDAWEDVLRAKLGFSTAEPGDAALAFDLLGRMASNQADYTLTFRSLSSETPEKTRDQFLDPNSFDAWFGDWTARIGREAVSPGTRQAAMQATNPAYIPRNHRVEAVIQSALLGDLAPFHEMLQVVADPFTQRPGYEIWQTPPLDGEAVQHTFCGT